MQLTFQLAVEELYNRPYYTATPNILVDERSSQWQEMKDWCETVLRARNSWPDMWSPFRMCWYANRNKFWFRSERDRDFFIKRFTNIPQIVHVV